MLCRKRGVAIDDPLLLKKVAQGIDRIVDLRAEDEITKEEAKRRIARQREREAPLKEELDQIDRMLDNIPTAESIAAAAREVMDGFYMPPAREVAARMRMRDHESMTWKDKRFLLEKVFSGKAPDGRPAGVYVESVPGYEAKRRKVWKLTLRGNLTTDQKDGYKTVVMRYALHSPAPAPPAPRCGAQSPRRPA